MFNWGVCDDKIVSNSIEIFFGQTDWRYRFNLRMLTCDLKYRKPGLTSSYEISINSPTWLKFLGPVKWFWQQQCCTRRGFYTHPTLKNGLKKAVYKPNCFSPNVKVLLAFRQAIFGFMYVHHLNKINKQKVINKTNRFLLNVMDFSVKQYLAFCMHTTQAELSFSEYGF